MGETNIFWFCNVYNLYIIFIYILMEKYSEIDGNLITFAKEGKFDLILHCANCYCTMGSGIAPQIAKAYPMAQEADDATIKGDMRKLGSFTVGIDLNNNTPNMNDGLRIINSYSQYHYHIPSPYGIPLDYDALTLSLRKINHFYPGKIIGLPQIGSGLAGGSWDKIKNIIQTELKDMIIIVVIFKE